MGKQVRQGKAFEYSCLSIFFNELRRFQKVVVEDSKVLRQAKQFYFSLNREMQSEMDAGANAAVRSLFRLEPQLQNPGKNIPLFLSLQKDKAGSKGDVRDIIAMRKQNNWEIGISVKHNHEAVKHSRLSQTIDFGKSWFGTPCSDEYFNEIRPIFLELSEMRELELKWRNIDQKAKRFYLPVLEAFKKEVERLIAQRGSVIPEEFLKYLLGRQDFYKIIADTKRRVTRMQAFSFFGTLNNPAGKIKPIYKIPQLQLPRTIHSIDLRPGSDNTLLIVCDQGWQLSARIHNASSKVEPSLKFDIKLIGLPPSVYTHDEPWDNLVNYAFEPDSDLVAEEQGPCNEKL